MEIMACKLRIHSYGQKIIFITAFAILSFRHFGAHNFNAAHRDRSHAVVHGPPLKAPEIPDHILDRSSATNRWERDDNAL